MSWASDLAARLISATDDLAQVARLSAAAILPGVDGRIACLELCQLIGEAAEPKAALDAIDELAGTDEASELVGRLIIHCFAAVRLDYPAQPDAATARLAVSTRARAAYPAIGDALGTDALDFVVRLVGQTVVELSRIAASRSPLVRVETALSLPSSLIAFDLYGDPARGEEIMGRNRTGTPMLMPIAIEAIGS